MRLHLVVLFLVAVLVAPAADISATEPLFQAIERADTAAMRRLLDQGVSADAVDSDGIPALMAAALFGGADCVKLLLDRGASPNASTRNGATALMWAMPDLEKARLLVAKGADVNARSTNLGRTPFLIAAGMPASVPLLRFLLDKGADLRSSDRGDVNGHAGTYQLTPLIYAASSDQAGVATLKLLLEKGADPNVADTDGEKPLDWAMHRFDRPKIDLLKEHGATEGSTPRDKIYPKPEGIADA